MKNKVFVENRHLVLVLNNYYAPVNICTVNRAYKLITKDRAEIVEADDTPMHSAEREYPRPSIIRLKNAVNFHHKKISVSRNNIFKRDNHKCGYCHSKLDLTVDHVIPKSKGGGYTWENLVTCCRKCNSKKDNRTPEEAGMKLYIQPYRPNFIFFIRNFNGNIKKGWDTYLD